MMREFSVVWPRTVTVGRLVPGSQSLKALSLHSSISYHSECTGVCILNPCNNENIELFPYMEVNFSPGCKEYANSCTLEHWKSYQLLPQPTCKGVLKLLG